MLGQQALGFSQDRTSLGPRWGKDCKDNRDSKDIEEKKDLSFALSLTGRSDDFGAKGRRQPSADLLQLGVRVRLSRS